MDIAATRLIAQVLVGLMVAGTLELNAAITQLEKMKQEVEKKDWRKRTELLVVAIHVVRAPEVGGISEQIGNAALIQLGQPAQHVKRRRVPGFRRPQLPVGEVLEG
jgi:hypothetical protein